MEKKKTKIEIKKIKDKEKKRKSWSTQKWPQSYVDHGSQSPYAVMRSIT